MKDHEQDILRQLPLSELHPFEDHPFSVLDDEQMQETVESIRSFGVLVPALVRPRENGGYEIVSGHRRKRACELAGLDRMPVIIREMSREEAVIAMVDSNLQRENILPSEKAKAYRMKLEAIRRSVGRKSQLTETENGDQVGHHLENRKSIEIIADDAGESKTQVQRYIRLTELEPELQQMVDDGKMGMTPAVEISYLKPEEQKLLLETMDSEQATPSLSQAQRMKQMSRMGTLNDDTMLEIMMEQKKPESYNIVIPGDRVRKYFPKSYSTERIQETILKLLDAWARKREKQMEK